MQDPLIEKIEIMSRLIEIQADAIKTMAQAVGTRLDRAQLAVRFGVHRNTLAKRIAEPGFPLPDSNGKWHLAEIVEWEKAEVRGKKK